MANKAILAGRVGKDPEVRTLSSGDKVANFSLATSERYKDKNGERKEITEWHNVSVFGNLAEKVVEPYIKKGQLLYIEGKIKTRSWESDGVKKYTTEIVLDNFNGSIEMLGKPQGSDDVVTPEQETVDPETGEVIDDLPF